MEDLTYYLNLKETVNIEMKESKYKVPDSFYETYSSFANTLGGTIYLGIREGNPNTIVGVDNPLQIKTNILNALNSKDKANICLLRDSDIRIIELDNKKILEIRVPKASREVKPVYINHNLSLSYTRISDGDYALDESEISTMLLEKRGISFDTVPNVLNFDFDSIDIESLHKFRELFNEENTKNFYKGLDDYSFLKAIGAIKKNNDSKEVLTYGGLMFFGNYMDIIQACPMYFLDYQENITNNTRWDYRLTSDDLSFNANIFNFYIKLIDRLITNLPNPFRTNGIYNFNGNDIKRAVIEGLANCLCNNDFTKNPGVVIKKTLANITYMNSSDVIVGVEQAISGGISKPRNVNIMNYFRLLNVCDKAGSGIPNIFNVFKENGLSTPTLEVLENPKRTILNLSFILVNRDEIDSNSKQLILSYLDSHTEGVSLNEICRVINKQVTKTSYILNQMLLEKTIITNGKKTKGRLFYINKN